MNVTEAEFRTGSAAIIQTLERSNVNNGAGIPLSNARILSLNASWSANATTELQIDFFLVYTTLLRCFISNVSIEN